MGKRMAQAALALFGRYPSRQLRELEASQWLSPEELGEMRNRKLGRLLVHACEHVPYYRKLFSECGIDPRRLRLPDDFLRIPFLSRDDVRRSFNDLIAGDSRPRDRMLNRTGGSTGARTFFMNDRRALPLHWALVLRNQRWTGWDIGRRQALLWAAYSDVTQSLQWHRRLFGRYVLRRLFLPAREMSDENMRRHAQAIDRFKPELITGYASALTLFARFLQRSGLRVHPPLAVVSAAEALEEGARAIVESVFRAPLFNHYGSREISNIAHECEAHSGLHINAEHVHVEVVDGRGRPCAPREKGEIVVTDLDNQVFPFIRYRIGDLGVAAGGNCSCGRGLPLLAGVLGRSFDVITTPDGRYLCVSGTLFWLGDVNGVRSFQLIQHDLRTLEFKIVADDSFTQGERAKLEQRVRERYGEPVDIRITLVDDIPVPESGKRMRVISKISPFRS